VAYTDGYSVAFPILRAMDIPYLYNDAFGATTCCRHEEKQFLEVSDNWGFSREICTYVRNTMGSILYPKENWDHLKTWRVPRPDLIVVSMDGCSTLVQWGEAMRQHCNVPLFVHESTYLWEGVSEDEAIEEALPVLEELVTWIEGVVGFRLDWDRLVQVMGHVKEASRLRMEAMDMANRAIPAAGTFFDWGAFLAGMNYLFGTEESTELYGELLEEVKERVRKKEGAVENERCRLYWDSIIPWPWLSTVARMFSELGAAVITGLYVDQCWFQYPERIIPEKPLESIADAVTFHFGNRPVEHYIKDIIGRCREYSLDGIVCHATRTCRTYSEDQLELMELLSRKLGIPGVFFEGDQADRTFYSHAQTHTRVEALVETIMAQKEKRE